MAGQTEGMPDSAFDREAISVQEFLLADDRPRRSLLSDEVRNAIGSTDFARDFVRAETDALPLYKRIISPPLRDWYLKTLYSEEGEVLVSWPEDALKAYRACKTNETSNNNDDAHADKNEEVYKDTLAEIGESISKARAEIQEKRGLANLYKLNATNPIFHYLTAPNERFLPVSKAAPALQILEDNFTAIRKEVLDFLENRTESAFPKIENVDVGQAYLSIGEDGSWRSVVLRTQYEDIEQNLQHFPVLKELLSVLKDDVCMVMLSMLTGKRQIKSHHGLFWGIYRYHLPLIVPEGEGRQLLTVGGEEREWKEGEAFVFDDNYSHSVINERDGCRVVLLIDVPKRFGHDVIDRINSAVLKVFNETEGMKELRQKAEVSVPLH